MLILSSVIVLCCVFFNKISDKFGLPALLAFILLGMLFGIDSYTKNKMQLPYKLDAKSSDAALREARMCAMTFYPRFSETEKPDVEVVKR